MLSSRISTSQLTWSKSHPDHSAGDWQHTFVALAAARHIAVNSLQRRALRCGEYRQCITLLRTWAAWQMKHQGRFFPV
jgi:hypothetical protein